MLRAVMGVVNCRCCNGRVVSVLEGGYNINGGIASAFARSVEAHVRGLAEPNSQVRLRQVAGLQVTWNSCASTCPAATVWLVVDTIAPAICRSIFRQQGAPLFSCTGHSLQEECSA